MTIPQLDQFYLDIFFANHGLSKILISNRDTHFISLLFKTLFSFLKTILAKSTVYHPQSDDQTETANEKIEDINEHSH